MIPAIQFFFIDKKIFLKILGLEIEFLIEGNKQQTLIN